MAQKSCFKKVSASFSVDQLSLVSSVFDFCKEELDDKCFLNEPSCMKDDVELLHNYIDRTVVQFNPLS